MPDPTSTEPDAPQAQPERETGPEGIETAPEDAGHAGGHPGAKSVRGPGFAPRPKVKTAGHDGSKPIPDDEREAFAQLLAAGGLAYEAYRKARGGRVPLSTAKSQASRWALRPEIAARVRWLRVQAGVGAKPAEKAPKTQPKTQPVAPPSQVDDSQPITREELVRKLTTLIRGGVPDATTINNLLKILPELAAPKDQQTDPGAVISHLASFAGRSGPDLVRELGGLPFMARRFAEVLRVSLAELAEACRTA